MESYEAQKGLEGKVCAHTFRSCSSFSSAVIPCSMLWMSFSARFRAARAAWATRRASSSSPTKDSLSAAALLPVLLTEKEASSATWACRDLF